MKLGTIDIEKIYVGGNEIEKGYVGSSEVYEENSGPDYTIPFYVEDVSGSDNTITLYHGDSNLGIEYSTDRTTWNSLGSSSYPTVVCQANGKVYFRASGKGWDTNRFDTATGSFKIGGNIMSLAYGSNFTGSETSFPQVSGIDNGYFYQIYKNNTNLISAEDLLLPLASQDKCFNEMFYGCTGLTVAPQLPSTEVSSYCYREMFYGCNSLTSAPQLPATTLATQCYREMFYNCTRLTTVPSDMLPSTTLAEGCYMSMFWGCSALATPPVLPAPTLLASCYSSMFRFAGVTQIICYATNISASGCTSAWVYNLTSTTGTFYKPQNMTSWGNGANGIPKGWTVVDIND